ncbi:MAG: hypothetical protein PHQ22_10365 [Sulfuricurvum sp.]|nr:hypothetical protein [Sulfuricurvum sp.]
MIAFLALILGGTLAIVFVMGLISLGICVSAIYRKSIGEKVKGGKIKEVWSYFGVCITTLFFISAACAITSEVHNAEINDIKQKCGSYISWLSEEFGKADQYGKRQYDIANNWALQWSPVEEKIKTMKKGDYITRDIIFNSTGQELTVMFKRIK